MEQNRMAVYTGVLGEFISDDKVRQLFKTRANCYSATSRELRKTIARPVWEAIAFKNGQAS
jgi:hypothetical protein